MKADFVFVLGEGRRDWPVPSPSPSRLALSPALWSFAGGAGMREGDGDAAAELAVDSGSAIHAASRRRRQSCDLWGKLACSGKMRGAWNAYDLRSFLLRNVSTESSEKLQR